MILRYALKYSAQHLLQTTAERHTAHGVQQEIDAEICVVEQHEELLETPERLRCILPRQSEEEHAQTNHVAETKWQLDPLTPFSCQFDLILEC